MTSPPPFSPEMSRFIDRAVTQILWRQIFEDQVVNTGGEIEGKSLQDIRVWLSKKEDRFTTQLEDLCGNPQEFERVLAEINRRIGKIKNGQGQDFEGPTFS